MPKPCEKDEIEMRIYKWYNVVVEIDEFLNRIFSLLWGWATTPFYYASLYGLLS